MDNPVVILGAGATKACDGPLTNEILFDAFTPEVRPEIEREDYLNLLDEFLKGSFHLQAQPECRVKTDYPPLPLLMSLIDTAIDRAQPFGSAKEPDDLRQIRAALEYIIFAVLDYRLKRLQRPTPHERMLNLLFPPPAEPQVISLNYDIIADNVMVAIGEARGLPMRFPDYSCDIRTDSYARWRERFGKLLKLHGSLHWLYCPGCHRLDIGVSRSGRYFAKVLDELYIVEGEKEDLNSRYSCHGSKCKDCGVFVRPVMITPTQKKDYRNPHIGQVWYQAEHVLRAASSAVFVGYSLPEDDVEVAYLFKRGLGHLAPDRITVIEHDDPPRPKRENPVWQRYRCLFGETIDWQPTGFLDWVKRQEDQRALATSSGV